MHTHGRKAWAAPPRVGPGRARRLGALSFSHSKPVLYGAFVWARGVLNSHKRRFRPRAVGWSLTDELPPARADCNCWCAAGCGSLPLCDSLPSRRLQLLVRRGAQPRAALPLMKSFRNEILDDYTKLLNQHLSEAPQQSWACIPIDCTGSDHLRLLLQGRRGLAVATGAWCVPRCCVCAQLVCLVSTQGTQHCDNISVPLKLCRIVVLRCALG